LERLAERAVAGGRRVQTRAQAAELADQQTLGPVGLGRVVVAPTKDLAREPFHDGPDALPCLLGRMVDVGASRGGGPGRDSSQERDGEQPGEAHVPALSRAEAGRQYSKGRGGPSGRPAGLLWSRQLSSLQCRRSVTDPESSPSRRRWRRSAPAS